MKKEKRFTESVSELLAEQGMSQRQLALTTRRRDGWGASGTISRMLAGDLPPSLEAMESIARVLNVKPSDWPEFRMAQWRHDLNPEKVGWPDAYATLREIELALD